MKHTEIPYNLDDKRFSPMDAENKERILQHGDKIVYASIRRFMNEDTKTCYPSISKIKEKAGCGQAKVESAIERLIKAGFLKVTKKRVMSGKWSHFYEFTDENFDKNFEMFTDDFLDMDLPINAKEYYMDIQRYMYDKESGVGKIGYTNAKLAELTGWTVQSIKKFNTLLIERGLLTEETTSKTNEAGLPIVQKNFNLSGFKQAELWARAVTQQVVQNTADIEDMKQKYDSEIDALHRKIEALEKAAALERNRVTEQNYTF